MTTSKKLTWGLILVFGAVFCGLIGVLLISTVIGACLGIPMIILAVPSFIWGMVWLFQAQFQRTKEVITAGVRDGIQGAAAAKPTPPDEQNKRG